MEIDRRNLLTGLATSTAAAILPAFPATAAVAEASRFYFRNGLIITKLTPHDGLQGLQSSLFNAVWHFDPGADGLCLIRHLPTGLTCRRAPQDCDRYAVQAISIDAELADWPESFVATVGQAARLVALWAPLVASCRWQMGAVFFRYTLDDPLHPYNHTHTEDAPPLSPDSPSGPPRGNRTVRTVPPSDLTGFFPPDA
jgi:hypothetical protein